MKFTQKKNKKQRGSKTHGWGAMKKHRGAGNRGGVGNAGSGKRGDAKKTRFQKEGRRFGKYGFNNSNSKDVKAINIVTIEKMAKADLLKKDGDSFSVNLKDLGYDKLLGAGKATMKLRITADFASSKAVSKVQAAGGAVTLPEAKE